MDGLTRHEIEKTASELMYYKDKLANGIFGDKIGCFDKAVEALKELQHYKDLEEQGRLIELPCAVGDTVWRISTKQDHPDERPYNIITQTKFRLDFLDAMGKTMFATKEEAEAKLTELRGE